MSNAIQNRSEARNRIEALRRRIEICQRPENDACIAPCIADLESIKTEIDAIIALLRG